MNQTPPSPVPPNSEPTVAQLQQEIAQLRQQYRAVGQYLWLAIRELRGDEHEITLKTDAIDPLWALAFLQVSDDKGEMDLSRIQILAGTEPPMTEQEKKRLVRQLRGTNKKLTEVLAGLKLNFPQAYVERFISDRVKWDVEKKIWVNTGTESEE